MSKLFEQDVRALEQMVRRLRGRKLPGERELAEQFGISRARVRVALDHLESRGLIARRQGSGTYALEDGSSLLNSVALLIDARLKLGNDPFFSTIVESLQHVCQAEGIRCTLERVDDRARPAIVEDGILAVGLATRRVLQGLRRGDVPAVGLFVHTERTAGARVTVLDVDDHAGGRRAAEQLIDMGCGRLWFVGHNTVPASDKRLAGAQEALSEVGRTIDVIDVGMNYSSGLESAARIEVDPAGAPTGIIAANDWLALGLHMGLIHREPPVRSRTEIISFDGLPMTADPSLRIRSFAVPLETMATDAVTELRRLVASPVACGREIAYPFDPAPMPALAV